MYCILYNLKGKKVYCMFYILLGKRVYSNYLESVVASEPETYKDIRGLMERCQVIQIIT